MGENDQKVERVITTRRFLDKRRNPWEYVDEELPTTSVHIFSRKKQGTLLDSGIGLSIMGSIQFTGSNYDTAPGSFSLRITRRSVYIGSRPLGVNTELEWKLRHSRLGTVDAIPFFLGTQLARARLPQNSEAVAQGNPMAPIYAFGPGTLWHYINPRRGTFRVYASMEGVF